MAETVTQGTEQLQGQQAFPGFEEPAPPPDAEEITRRAGKVAFTMDYMRSPEDALISWDVDSTVFSSYLQQHFEMLVNAVANATGADPEQIRDKNRRTPKQEELLTLIAAKEQIARIDAFFACYYYNALQIVDTVEANFDARSATQDSLMEMGLSPEFSALSEDAEAVESILQHYTPPVREQAVVYFFAKHDDIDPRANGKLTEEQADELRGIFSRLDALYLEKTASGLPNPEDNRLVFSQIFAEFIRRENPAAGAAETILANLPLLQSLNPTAHTMPNNTLMNALQTDRLIENPDGAQGWDITVAKAKNRRKEITAYTMVTYDPGDTGITITDSNLTEYERQVSDAVVSLWIEANKENLPPVFTPDMIYRSMPGGSDKASPQQKGAITRTIEKFRRLHITVDASDEMRKRGIIGPDKTFKLDDFYLSAVHAEYRAKNGGQTVNAYRLNSEPIILTYSKMTKQILTVPAEYIAIEKVKENPLTKKLEKSGELLMMNAERQAMTGYLLRRIAIMKRDREKAKEALRKYNNSRKKDPELEEKTLADFREQSEAILFDSIFEDAGIKIISRDKALDNRNFCFDVLDYQEAVGNIKGYEKQTKGRSITGVKILL